MEQRSTAFANISKPIYYAPAVMHPRQKVIRRHDSRSVQIKTILKHYTFRNALAQFTKSNYYRSATFHDHEKSHKKVCCSQFVLRTTAENKTKRNNNISFYIFFKGRFVLIASGFRILKYFLGGAFIITTFHLFLLITDGCAH